MAESIAITYVKVFDGNALTEERSVVIEKGIISAATTADTIVDGQYGTLLPGFIDSHVHLRNTLGYDDRSLRMAVLHGSALALQ